MRLKSIKLAGFKSFVDPTTVNFPSNMCAVVGPNGCGKSNVIDAVRWVMGESSAKNLRGESMADVIFNGSVNRQPLGQASIELIFDNSDGGVGGEYASYAEIAIKRLVSREGQSEYYLNSTRCRRRDITDIFLGTGLGPRSYAIIEQGMISRLIESKPEELRIFIEEAAGISKYKERRRETESRMRRTLENLERLTDLREELERQLQHLKRQAAAAEKYASFKHEERELTAQLQGLQWQALDQQVGERSRVIGELEVKLEAVHAEHQQVETAIEQQRQANTEASDEFNEVQARYYSLGSEVSRIEQTIKHQEERARQLQEDLEATSSSYQNAQSHLQDDRHRLQGWTTEIAELAPELDSLGATAEASTERLLAAEQTMHSWQQQWDDFNQHAAQPRQQAEVQQSRIQHIEQVQARIQRRDEQLQQELVELPEQSADTETEALTEQLAQLDALVEEHESVLEAQTGEIQMLRDSQDSQTAQLNEARTELQRMHGRQASLEALQQAARELGSTDVNDWLNGQSLSDNPRMLDKLEVDEGWQLAVETVLGDALQAVCVDDTSALAPMLEKLEQGALTLIDGGASVVHNTSLLSSKVRGVHCAAEMLSGVYTAANLAEALARRNELEPHQSLITADGIWLGRYWLRVARDDDGQGSIIRRQQELDQLEQLLEEQEDCVQALADALDDSNRGLKEAELKRQESQRQLQQANRDHAEANSALSARCARTEQISARRDDVLREIEDAARQFTQEQTSIAEARQLLSAAIESMESDSQRREELLSERDKARTELDEARQKARQDKDASHQLEMRHQSLQTQISSVTESIERANSQVEQLLQRRTSLKQSIDDNSNPVEALQRELELQLEQRLQVEGELAKVRGRVADIEHQLREAETRRAGIDQRAEAVRNELEQQRLGNQSLQVQRQAIRSQLEQSDHQLELVLASLPEDASAADWQRSLEQVANRIARLGPINLAAIDEYALQSERKNYLDMQNEDLETALETLESAIRKIDKETRSRFRETFDKINSGLQELFPRVFGGGSATLEMTGDDLLDTGISIMARPPGKKNSTIHLLSGGEKALTAIALVFSIFQLNPAPFCMLDEVDAPLDDANVGRYARMVKEMSGKVQFIFITHNKISMELADQLLGVTMHEPGVSRLVSVDVEEAAELAAS